MGLCYCSRSKIRDTRNRHLHICLFHALCSKLTLHLNPHQSHSNNEAITTFGTFDLENNAWNSYRLVESYMFDAHILFLFVSLSLYFFLSLSLSLTLVFDGAIEISMPRV